jgi:hypothetical protein
VVRVDGQCPRYRNSDKSVLKTVPTSPSRRKKADELQRIFEEKAAACSLVLRKTAPAIVLRNMCKAEANRKMWSKLNTRRSEGKDSESSLEVPVEPDEEPRNGMAHSRVSNEI